MRLEVEKLPPARSLTHTYTPSELGWEDAEVSLSAPLEVTCTIKRKGWEVRVAGTLQTSISIACDRCLQPAELIVNTAFAETFVPETTYQPGRTEDLRDEDLQTSSYDGVTLDLAELFRTEILLSVPAQVLCRTACAGLCPQCGVNRNVTACVCAAAPTDPRWDALKKLRS